MDGRRAPHDLSRKRMARRGGRSARLFFAVRRARRENVRDPFVLEERRAGVARRAFGDRKRRLTMVFKRRNVSCVRKNRPDQTPPRRGRAYPGAAGPPEQMICSVAKRPSFFTLPSPSCPDHLPAVIRLEALPKIPGRGPSHGADDVSIDQNIWFSTPTNGESPWKRLCQVSICS